MRTQNRSTTQPLFRWSAVLLIVGVSAAIAAGDHSQQPDRVTFRWQPSLPEGGYLNVWEGASLRLHPIGEPDAAGVTWILHKRRVCRRLADTRGGRKRFEIEYPVWKTIAKLGRAKKEEAHPMSGTFFSVEVDGDDIVVHDRRGLSVSDEESKIVQSRTRKTLKPPTGIGPWLGGKTVERGRTRDLLKENEFKVPEVLIGGTNADFTRYEIVLIGIEAAEDSTPDLAVFNVRMTGTAAPPKEFADEGEMSFDASGKVYVEPKTSRVYRGLVTGKLAIDGTRLVNDERVDVHLEGVIRSAREYQYTEPK